MGEPSIATVSTARQIAIEELSTHHTREDAWIALRGKVYNITEYISLHPGGLSPISKGFGKDATALFNSVHAYVNFESLLRGKQMGVLKPLTAADKEKAGLKGGYQNAAGGNSGNEESMSSGGCFCSKLCKGSPGQRTTEFQKIPTLLFQQDDTHCTFQVDTDGFNCTENNWMVGIIDRSILIIKLLIKSPKIWIAHYKLLEPLIDDAISVEFHNNFRRMIVTFRKPTAVLWKSLGTAMGENNKTVDCRIAIDDLYEGFIFYKNYLTPDVVMMGIELRFSARIGVPVGFHMKVAVKKIHRRYTPVCFSLIGDQAPLAKYDGQTVFLIMKVYPDGELTPVLNNFPVGNNAQTFKIGSCSGNFDTDFLIDTHTLLFLVGGSGITPFIRIVEYLISRKSDMEGKYVLLLFFNHKEEDIILCNEWTVVAANHGWFHFLPVLTRAEINWTGLQGRPSRKTVEKAVSSVSGACTKAVKILVCGNEGFNACCRELVSVLPYQIKATHIFAG